MTERKRTTQRPEVEQPQWGLSDKRRREVARAVIVTGVVLLFVGLQFHVVYVLPFGADPSAAHTTGETLKSDLPGDAPAEPGADDPFDPFGDAGTVDDPFAETPSIDGDATAGDEEARDPNEPFAMLEAEMIKEITIGGLKRLAGGEIQQTYSAEKGEVPEACPT